MTKKIGLSEAELAILNGLADTVLESGSTYVSLETQLDEVQGLYMNLYQAVERARNSGKDRLIDQALTAHAPAYEAIEKHRNA